MQLAYSILFGVVFLVITNWFQIISFISAFSRPAKNVKKIKDIWITNLLKKKANLSLETFTLFVSEKPFGMMAGIYPWPKMILSSKLYKTFTKRELEWVVLHEAAHYNYWHNLKAAFVEIGLLLAGLFFVNSLFSSIILGIILSVLSVRIMRIFEYEADYFAIQNVEDPKSVISAQKKMRKGYNTGIHRWLKEGSILREMLLWNIKPSQRIALARERMNI